MACDPEIQRILCEHLHNPSSSFSIGSFGAIAEFHRGAGEPLALDDPERMTVATDRGALRIDLTDSAMPLAYESLSGRPGRWRHGMVFCLPETLAASHGRSTLTELGADQGAIRAVDRDAVLFDMGLKARNIDFCIRTQDPELLSLLRRNAGKSVLASGNPVMNAIVEAAPHRIARSQLGRAEVYQAIDKVKTPQGPHTHVLPKFLISGRTHSANIPLPTGYLPCLSLYPANPLYDGAGCRKAFDPASFAAFEALLDRWGVPEYCAEKARAVDAFRRDLDPDIYECPRTRLGRTALRVALRQMRQVDESNPALQRWRNRFDPAVTRINRDRDEVQAPPLPQVIESSELNIPLTASIRSASSDHPC